jgi:hypothetical protein
MQRNEKFAFFRLKGHFIFERKSLTPKVHILEHLLKNICFSNAPKYADYGEFEVVRSIYIYFLSKNTDLNAILPRLPQQEIISKPQNFSVAWHRKCAESGGNPIFRDSPKICIF